jgi:hypothetical protein
MARKLLSQASAVRVAQVGPFVVQLLEALHDSLGSPVTTLADQLVIKSRPADGMLP